MSLETKTRFEILIAELLDDFKITTSEELTKVMEELHQWLENGAYDYAIDLGIYDDYEPSY